METLIPKNKIPFKKVATIGILPSFLKKFIYRLKGHQIGKNVSIGFGSIIVGKKVIIEDHVKIGLITIVRAEKIHIEKYAAVGSFTMIDTGKLRIGEDARINEQVIVGGMKTPQSELDLGKRTIIMEYSFINTTMPIRIGDDSGIGGHCLLFTHGSWLNQLEGFPVNFAPITIGNSVWLPWRVFIMPGVTIGDKVVVGANSMISKSVPSNCLVAGSPARVLKENYPSVLTEKEKLDVFREFIHDFVAHLNYNGIVAEQSESEANFIISNTTGSNQFELVVEKTEQKEFSSRTNDVVIITNVNTNIRTLPPSPQKGKMYIDIFNKQRTGTSKIGEEFAKFISRYGIRLERR